MQSTYSPEDNKLRLYPTSRLDAETYARVRAAGFTWAPKQELFVAPAWTPERADLAEELAGEIGDEDTTLVDRAETRAERFDGYSDKRAADSERAREAVAAIADGIPLGQPILVGHHSERHARRDAERIENGMRRAVKMWETSQYWQRRAEGALAHAKYKERPDVRARRIKGLEADLRRFEKETRAAHALMRLWRGIETGEGFKSAEQSLEATWNRARAVANHDPVSRCYPVADFPRLRPDARMYEGQMGLWEALDGIITPQQAQAFAIEFHERMNATRARWITHTENRLAYERAMLAASGWTPAPKPKTPAALPLLNYGGVVAYRNPYRSGEIIRCEAHGMTRAEYAAIHADYKGTRVSECGTHRVRTALVTIAGTRSLVTVVLTDAKQHPRPTAETVSERAAEEAQERMVAALDRVALDRAEQPRVSRPDVPPEIAAMRESLRDGVQVVSAPQLFPTPPDLAARVVAAAEVRAGDRTLEPSAGTGALVRAAQAVGAEIVAVEINQNLAKALHGCTVVAGDFLEQNGNLGTFDRIVMNPPFSGASDITHVLHARKFLRPGGCLAAIVADGPRQNERLRPMADSWEEIPAGTFAGTGVRTVLMTIRG